MRSKYNEEETETPLWQLPLFWVVLGSVSLLLGGAFVIYLLNKSPAAPPRDPEAYKREAQKLKELHEREVGRK